MRARNFWAALAVAAVVGGTVTSAPTAALAAPTSASDTVAGPDAGTYVPVTPSRILDTRTGLGAPQGPTTGTTLTVLGRGGVPSTGVAAVVLNVTVTDPESIGWLSVGPYPTRETSNINYVGHDDVAQLVESAVAADGTVSLFSLKSTQVVADVVGWFTDPAHVASGGTYTPVTTPVRAFDSRVAGAGGALRNGQVRKIALPNRPAGATAAVVNLTAINPDHQAYLSAWPGGTWTGTSSINIAPGDIRSNRAVVPIGSDGTISLLTNALSVDAVVDVNGWFGGTGGALFVPTAPVRVLSAGESISTLQTPDPDNVVDGGVLQLAGTADLPPTRSLSPLVGVWASTTVSAFERTGWAAFSPYDAAVTRPPVVSSDVNFQTDSDTPNVTILPVGDGGKVRMSSTSSVTSTQFPPEVGLFVDVAGYFVASPAAHAPGLWQQGDGSVTGAWNHAVLGVTGDVISLASDDHRGAALRRDGSVVIWPGNAPDDATVLDPAASAIAGGRYGLFVLHADGTVWTDSASYGSRGVAGAPTTGYGPVAGVAGATSVYVGSDVAYVLHADGSVTGWGVNFLPGTPTATPTGPVRTLAVDPNWRRRCTAYRDGSVEIRSVDNQISHLATGLDVVTATAVPGPSCVVADATGHLTLLTLQTPAGSDPTVTTTALPGPTAAQVVPTFTSVLEDGQVGGPSFRALGTDGVVRDWVGDHWVVQPGLTGATVVGGGLSMLTYVPPTN